MLKGAYSNKYKKLQRINSDPSLTSGLSILKEREAKVKELSRETNRRRRDLEEKKKQLELNEEKRRQRVLSARRDQQRDATERFQKYSGPIGKRRHSFDADHCNGADRSLKDGVYIIGHHTVEIRDGKRIYHPSSQAPGQTAPSATHCIRGIVQGNECYLKDESHPDLLQIRDDAEYESEVKHGPVEPKNYVSPGKQASAGGSRVWQSGQSYLEQHIHGLLQGPVASDRKLFAEKSHPTEGSSSTHDVGKKSAHEADKNLTFPNKSSGSSAGYDKRLEPTSFILHVNGKVSHSPLRRSLSLDNVRCADSLDFCAPSDFKNEQTPLKSNLKQREKNVDEPSHGRKPPRRVTFSDSVEFDDGFIIPACGIPSDTGIIASMPDSFIGMDNSENAVASTTEVTTMNPVITTFTSTPPSYVSSTSMLAQPIFTGQLCYPDTVEITDLHQSNIVNTSPIKPCSFTEPGSEPVSSFEDAKQREFTHSELPSEGFRLQSDCSIFDSLEVSNGPSLESISQSSEEGYDLQGPECGNDSLPSTGNHTGVVYSPSDLFNKPHLTHKDYGNHLPSIDDVPSSITSPEVPVAATEPSRPICISSTPQSVESHQQSVSYSEAHNPALRTAPQETSKFTTQSQFISKNETVNRLVAVSQGPRLMQDMNSGADYLTQEDNSVPQIGPNLTYRAQYDGRRQVEATAYAGGKETNAVHSGNSLSARQVYNVMKHNSVQEDRTGAVKDRRKCTYELGTHEGFTSRKNTMQGPQSSRNVTNVNNNIIPDSSDSSDDDENDILARARNSMAEVNFSAQRSTASRVDKESEGNFLEPTSRPSNVPQTRPSSSKDSGTMSRLSNADSDCSPNRSKSGIPLRIHSAGRRFTSPVRDDGQQEKEQNAQNSSYFIPHPPSVPRDWHDTRQQVAQKEGQFIRGEKINAMRRNNDTRVVAAEGDIVGMHVPFQGVNRNNEVRPDQTHSVLPMRTKQLIAVQCQADRGSENCGRASGKDSQLFIPLDKTPTDDEINVLWENVRNCLHGGDQDVAYSDSAYIRTSPRKHYNLSNHVGPQKGHAFREVGPELSKFKATSQHRPPFLPFRRYGSQENLRRQNSLDNLISGQSSGGQAPFMQRERLKKQSINPNSDRVRSARPPKASSKGPSRSFARGNEVSDSLASFLDAEALCNEEPLGPSQTLAVFRASHSLHQKIASGQNLAMQRRHAPSALSIEEKKAMESLERLNMRLRDQEALTQHLISSAQKNNFLSKGNPVELQYQMPTDYRPVIMDASRRRQQAASAPTRRPQQGLLGRKTGSAR